jgi:DNA topoisomerase-1
VVVESAAKAKTIEKFLGRGYAVRACLGHVRDLPTSKLGVDVEHDFTPQYVVPRDRKDVVKMLKDEARGASSVLLATDPDREGEAIAWHLVNALDLNGDSDKPVSRIEFHEITRGAIEDALAHPRSIDMHRVDAQQARRVLDRLIGYPVSNFLGRKIRRGLSAGRVQSVAVRMVVEREREIESFVPVEYWSLEAELAKLNADPDRQSFVAALTQRAGEKIELHTGVEAETVKAELDGARWSVANLKEEERRRRPAAPFTTSTLQQEASRKLNFSARRTMAVAQQLYEGVPGPSGKRSTGASARGASRDKGDPVGLITYMRTDSVTVAQTAQAEAREYIGTRLGKELLPPQSPVYTTRSKLAQEAHEAIRPTSVFREPEAWRPYLSNEQFRLYELIWRRFVASQMANAVYDVTTVDVDAQAPEHPLYRFRATGSRLRFRGFLTLYLEGRDDDVPLDEERQPLPPLSVGELLNLLKLIPEQHFTQPPPRYTEATLVKALEEHGVGRPSTYAPILSTIQERGYVEREERGKRLVPTALGTLVNGVLVDNFGDIVDLDFTATLEDKLDQVAQGGRTWVPVVDEFYGPLRHDLEQADRNVERIKVEVPTDEVCTDGHPMVIKEGRFGRFLACTQYPEHKETRPVPDELPPDLPDERCSHDLPMQPRTGRYGPFYASTHECGETKAIARRVGVACPLDGGELVEKRSRKGRTFYGCDNWPSCEWVSWYRPIPEPCPQCGGLQVDMGRGRLHCLKHEGEPQRFVRKPDDQSNGTPKASANGTAGRGARTATRARANGRTTTRRATTRKPAARGSGH